MALELCHKCTRKMETCSCLTIYKRNIEMQVTKAKAITDIEEILKILRKLKEK